MQNKNSVELLIERIQKIQQDLAQESNDDEIAFTEAAEEHIESIIHAQLLSGGKK